MTVLQSERYRPPPEEAESCVLGGFLDSSDRQCIQRTAGGVEMTPGQMQIDRSLFQVTMTQQHLDGSQISASLERAFGVWKARRAQSLLGPVHAVHHHLRRALRSCRAVQQGDDVHLCVGENLGHVSQGSGSILQRDRELLHFSHGMPPLVESDKIALRIVRTSAAIWQGHSVSGGTRQAAGKLKGCDIGYVLAARLLQGSQRRGTRTVTARCSRSLLPQRTDS